jgi:uncharacterized protein YoxC
MNSFFLFIIVIAIVLVAAALIVVSIYVVKILRDVRRITQKVSSEADEIISDVDDARAFLKKEMKRAISIKELIAPIFDMVMQKRKRSSRKKKDG